MKIKLYFMIVIIICFTSCRNYDIYYINQNSHIKIYKTNSDYSLNIPAGYDKESEEIQLITSPEDIELILKDSACYSDYHFPVKLINGYMAIAYHTFYKSTIFLSPTYEEYVNFNLPHVKYIILIKLSSFTRLFMITCFNYFQR